MDTSLTQAAATQRAVDLLEKTLAALPPGVSLSRRSDNPALGGSLGPGTVVPCDDNDEAGTGPASLGVTYWLNGVPKGQDVAYFDKLVDLWTSWGWKPSYGKTSRWAAYNGPDGYALIVQNAAKGDGSLSIAAETPCFPAVNKDPHPHQPSRVERPAGS